MIIDAHSHIGNEKFNNRKEITINTYVDFMNRVGIDVGMVMPVPCPLVPDKFFNFQKGKTILSWKYIDNHYEFFSDVEEITKRKLKNPYYEVNKYYNSIVNKNNLNKKIVFVPIIHPILDTDQYLEELITTVNPVALKIHSVGTLCSPLEIRKSYTEIIKKYDIPIIVHTDYNNGNFDKNIGVFNAVSKAEAMKWFEYFEKNKIHGTLNHGATLNLDVFDKVNNSDYVKIGIEPSIYFGSNYGRLNIDKKLFEDLGFLKILRKYLHASKIIFDVDYDYNRLSENEIDYDAVARIKKIWSGLDVEKILYLNALEQYPKLIKKIKEY